MKLILSAMRVAVMFKVQAIQMYLWKLDIWQLSLLFVAVLSVAIYFNIWIIQLTIN